VLVVDDDHELPKPVVCVHRAGAHAVEACSGSNVNVPDDTPSRRRDLDRRRVLDQPW
jgi:hypothetical protein